jgi:PAS domain S-box-containing protein
MQMSEIVTSIIEQTSDAIMYADQDGIVRLWNSGATRIFGYTAAEAIGRSLDLIIPEQLRDRHWQGWKSAMASGSSRYSTELLAVPALHRDGRKLSIEFSVVIVKDGNG